MGMRKRLKPYEDTIRELGGDVVETKSTGSHFQIVYTYRGNTRSTTVPNSSSDRRSVLNWKSDVKRQMMEASSGQ